MDKEKLEQNINELNQGLSELFRTKSDLKRDLNSKINQAELEVFRQYQKDMEDANSKIYNLKQSILEIQREYFISNPVSNKTEQECRLAGPGNRVRRSGVSVEDFQQSEPELSDLEKENQELYQKINQMLITIDIEKIKSRESAYPILPVNRKFDREEQLRKYRIAGLSDTGQFVDQDLHPLYQGLRHKNESTKPAIMIQAPEKMGFFQTWILKVKNWFKSFQK